MQSKTEFDSFASNFDEMCKKVNDENPHCAIYLGNFNAHPSECNQLQQLITDQPNIFINCEIIPSLHTNCHHQINQVPLNIRSPPPPFSRRVWHYDQAQVHLIKRAISDYDWITEYNLCSTDPNLQVKHLTAVLNNVLTNFIPHDDATIKPKAHPWAELS